MKDSPAPPIALPAQVPVMVLPGAVLFPQTMLPLMIFEPRYRAMLASSLDQQRMICIALLKPGLSDWSSPADFHHVAGVGLIRACVGHEDGTSHLMLQGLARVELTGFPQVAPFVVAEIRALPSEEDDDDSVTGNAAILKELQSYCARLAKIDKGTQLDLEHQLAEVTDAGTLCDLLANTLLQDAAHRQEVLETRSASGRLTALLRNLENERGS